MHENKAVCFTFNLLDVYLSFTLIRRTAHFLRKVPSRLVQLFLVREDLFLSPQRIVLKVSDTYDISYCRMLHFIYTLHFFARTTSSITMTSNPLNKVSRQHERTWTSLQRRISGMSYDYSTLFPQTIIQFLTQKPISVGSSVQYFAPTLLTTTAFILANNHATVRTSTYEHLPNLYTLVVGYPGTGKSAAVDLAATTPMLAVTEEDDSLLLGRATSSALVKQVAENGKAYLVSSEIYDILNKLMTDDETSSGDVQLLCKLFSGERASYHYSTEKVREIPAKTPFSILRCTQMPNIAKVIARMDKGHGLIDRFLISVPLVLRPTPQQQEDACAYIATEAIDNFDAVFQV